MSVFCLSVQNPVYMKRIYISLLFLLSALSLMANNIQVYNAFITGQDYDNDYCFVQFDLSIDNSWRTSSPPYNWDAAWVFIKYRIPGGEWQHMYIDDTEFYGPPEATIEVPTDETGAFVYRSSDGSGNVFWYGIQLRWNYGLYGVPDDAAVEIKVFAIEMVYIPEGPFYLGDAAADSTFYEVGSPNEPFLVDGTQITIGTGTGNLYATGEIGNGMEGQILNSNYPTGYDAFYCMKYEMSQIQYVDFLNCLTRYQQNVRTESEMSGASTQLFVMSDEPYPIHRNGISFDISSREGSEPIVFFCDGNENMVGNEDDDGLNVAMNYTHWADLAAYADWAGLRPMTEAEFEKACRGPNTPVPMEFAWGNSTIHNSIYTMANYGYEDEIITDLGVFIGNSSNQDTYSHPSYYPRRCGIFAASAMMDPNVGNTRMETGGSYYGVMEMSGNLLERTVGMMNIAGISFRGDHGDGELLPVGNANVDYWPGSNGNDDADSPNTTFSGVLGIYGCAGSGFRGGHFSASISKSHVSDRSFASIVEETNWPRNSSAGIRLARSQP